MVLQNRPTIGASASAPSLHRRLLRPTLPWLRYRQIRCQGPRGRACHHLQLLALTSLPLSFDLSGGERLQAQQQRRRRGPPPAWAEELQRRHIWGPQIRRAPTTLHVLDPATSHLSSGDLHHLRWWIRGRAPRALRRYPAVGVGSPDPGPGPIPPLPPFWAFISFFMEN